MKSHVTENILPANPRFHTPRADGLFQPIRFVFVTDQMHRDIAGERQSILAAMPPAQHAEQQKIFDRYDPQASARAFESILVMFGVTGQKDTD